ncbi:MAG: hypothetical protein RMM30_02175 [Armatimonadota bacterium]|nr:hypothetical protein [Armatimonadota bacterium]MDW8155379.1 hypothetical protein [Armatimonadota bacterium]
MEDWGAVFRWVSGGLTQGVFTAAAGAALGWADLKVLSAPARSLSAVLGMGASVAGHLAYVGFNFLAWRSGVGGELAAVGLLLLSWSPAALLAGVWVAERRYRRSAAEQYLREEVEAGLLSEGELLVLVRGTRGIPPALRSALLQVALAKWRLVRGRGKEAEVQAWRDRVTALRRGRRVAC